MINGKTYYQILAVLPDAEDIVIRAAYKSLSQKYHPDKWQGDTKIAHDRMSEINHAYQVLSDSDRRSNYDKELESTRNDYAYSEPSDDKEVKDAGIPRGSYPPEKKDTKEAKSTWGFWRLIFVLIVVSGVGLIIMSIIATLRVVGVI